MAERPAPLPDLDWSPQRAQALGIRMVDVWRDFLASVPDRRVSPGLSAEQVRDTVTMGVPDHPLPEPELLEHVRSVVDHSMYPGHPAFMAYITGAGTVPGAAADFIAAALNQNLGGWRLSPAATEIEVHLLRWFAERFGLPADTAGGLMTSGGAMANFIALKAARDRHAGWDVRARGLREGPQLTAYASDEVHVVSDRALDMLGIGFDHLRKVPTDAGLRLRVDALTRMVEQDVADGLRPFAVIASAGTVATGAIDPLPEVADLCRRHGLWFHVDGAYGALAAADPTSRPLFEGIERAHSLALDPHKWLYTPHSGGCVVARDVDHLRRAFDMEPSYIHEDRGRTGSGQDLGRLGPQFSRGFQAFKVWISLLAHGRAAYARRISHDAELARYMGALVEERADLELMASVGLSICCFRYAPDDLASSDAPARDTYLDALNERLMTELWLDGRVFLSNAVLGGRFCLRACIVNFRTEAEQVELVLDVVAELGKRLDGELRPDALR
jgi:glutamate/tyrosine decarboxylase-like PLP-dependent enzyme